MPRIMTAEELNELEDQRMLAEDMADYLAFKYGLDEFDNQEWDDRDSEDFHELED